VVGALGQTDALCQGPLGVVKVEVVELVPAEHGTGAACVLDLAGGQRDPQALLHQRPCHRVSELPPRGTEVGQSMGQDRGIAHLAGQGDGALADGHAVAGAEGQHVELGLVAERQGEQPAVAGRLQHGDRLRAAALGGGAVAGPPLHPGQPAQVRPERALVAQRPAQPDRLRLDNRGLGGTDRVALDGVPLQQLGKLGREEALAVTDDQPVMGDRLTVGASAGRVPGGRRPVVDDRVRVAGLSCVVDDARQVGGPEPDQRAEHPPVQLHPARHRHRVRDRPPGELVPERHRGR
jgi:hypothetical protein